MRRFVILLVLIAAPRFGAAAAADHRSNGRPRRQPSIQGIDALRADFVTKSGGDTVYFGDGSAQLGAPASATLAAQASGCASIRRCRCGSKGHGDPGDTRDHALAIGARRAKEVRDYLVLLGVPAAQLGDHQLGQGTPRRTAGRRDDISVRLILSGAALVPVSASQARAWRWASAISRAVISSAISARHSWPRVQPDKRREVEPFMRFERSTNAAAPGRKSHAKLEQGVDIAALRRRQAGSGSETPRPSG